MSATTYAVVKVHVGIDAVFKFGVIGGDGTVASWVTLKNSDWEISLKADNKEAPNTSDGMLRGPGLGDYALTVKGSTDCSAMPTGGTAQAAAAATAWATASESMAIRPGSIVAFRAYRSYTADTAAGGFFSGAVLMDSLKIASGVSTTDNWDAAASKQSGPLIFPDGSVW